MNANNETNETKTRLNEESLELYPERRGQKLKKNWLNSMLSRDNVNQLKCEQKVFDVINESMKYFIIIHN